MTPAAILVLAAGTFAFRVAGPMLRNRITVSERADTLLKRMATVLLVGLVATAALTDDGGFAGWALPCGVVVGGLLAWRRAPLIVVIIAAAVCTAMLRLAGVA